MASITVASSLVSKFENKIDERINPRIKCLSFSLLGITLYSMASFLLNSPKTYSEIPTLFLPLVLAFPIFYLNVYSSIGSSES